MAGYDPVAVSSAVEGKVYSDERGIPIRRYFRFRVDRWYGGIVTGDVVGCNMRCRFCWAWYFTWGNPSCGRFYPPDEVVARLVSMARRAGYPRARLSGGEPTIGFKHMLKVAEGVTNSGIIFVLETNGILVGRYEEYAKALAGLRGRGIEVRVSVKGTSPEEFHELTGADPSFWYVQLKALENLVSYGLRPAEEVYPAVMLSLSGEEGLRRFSEVVRSIHPDLAELIDEEYIIMYRHVRELLKRTGLRPRYVVFPDSIPVKMV